MSTLIYKDIQGSTEFDQDSNIFFGKLIGINGVVMYEGENAEEFKKNFMSAVDEYIEICEQSEIPIKKEFKGVFNVRTTPEIHEKLNAICVRKDIKMNTIVNEALSLYLDRENAVQFKRLPNRKAHLRTFRGLVVNPESSWNLITNPALYWETPCPPATMSEYIKDPKGLVK